MDFVVYKKRNKQIVSIILDLKEEPRFLICSKYVGVYLSHDSYRVIDSDDGLAYFENQDEKIIWLDDYR